MLDLRWVVANLDEAKRRLATRSADAAAALGITEVNAKVNFHHAVQRLKGWLGGAE